MENIILTESQVFELRQKYNPDGLLLRKHQMELLDMPQTLANICDKYNIQ